MKDNWDDEEEEEEEEEEGEETGSTSEEKTPAVEQLKREGEEEGEGEGEEEEGEGEEEEESSEESSESDGEEELTPYEKAEQRILVCIIRTVCTYPSCLYDTDFQHYVHTFGKFRCHTYTLV